MKGIVRGLLVTALVTAVASPASAGGWPWPLGSCASLGFGEPWTDAAGRTCTHRGMDIAAPPGEVVRSCTGGTVRFSGPVPSAAGGRVIALTVRSEEGLDVTYLPLERASVTAGDELQAGQSLGELATAGDGSSPSPHLHLSVKKGDLPVDPSTLLAPAPGLAAPVAIAEAPERGSSGGDPTGTGRDASNASLAAAEARTQPSPSPAAAPEAVTTGLTAPTAPAGTAAASGRPAAALPAWDSRAVHSLPAASARWSWPQVRVPAAAPSLMPKGLGLLAGIAAAFALWVRAQRLGTAVPAGSDGRRS